jgi:hypothetical protein
LLAQNMCAAVMFAAERGHTKIVASLLARGAVEKKPIKLGTATPEMKLYWAHLHNYGSMQVKE